MVVEKAFFMFEDNPMIALTFKNERLVEAIPTGYRTVRPDLNIYPTLSVKELEYMLLKRRIDSGRKRRYDYFGGRVSPYQELKMYHGADLDDHCWLRFEEENHLSWKDVFFIDDEEYLKNADKNGYWT